MEGCYGGYINDGDGGFWLWNNNRSVFTPWAVLDTIPQSTPGLAQMQFRDVLTMSLAREVYTGKTLYINLATAYEHWLVRVLSQCTLPAPILRALILVSQSNVALTHIDVLPRRIYTSPLVVRTNGFTLWVSGLMQSMRSCRRCCNSCAASETCGSLRSL